MFCKKNTARYNGDNAMGAGKGKTRRIKASMKDVNLGKADFSKVNIDWNDPQVVQRVKQLVNNSHIDFNDPDTQKRIQSLIKNSYIKNVDMSGANIDLSKVNFESLVESGTGTFKQTLPVAKEWNTHREGDRRVFRKPEHLQSKYLEEHNGRYCQILKANPADDEYKVAFLKPDGSPDYNDVWRVNWRELLHPTDLLV